MKFKRIKGPIEGLMVIEPTLFKDDRGYFMEAYNKNEFSSLGINQDFVQDNHSKSMKGVLRGLHFQIKNPQRKLIRVIRGSVYDVAVDCRRRSPTFKKYFGIELSEKNNKMLYIPEGFAHGFLTLTEEVDLIYKVTDYYNVEYDCGIVWNDPEIMIQWPFEENGIVNPILSEKDKNLPRIADIKIPFSYQRDD
ncbi:MAG: dTDP-4-dehydrorhamnose 3,5-epimerase [Candidatus Hodarchaeota archaeon]|jgi:dTDP-4-dehydrorhamnose 3,5-epimerase